jgi:hypothetical protein
MDMEIVEHVEPTANMELHGDIEHVGWRSGGLGTWSKR